MNINDKKSAQFYFALPRAIAMLFGGNAVRSESNGFEAALVGLWIYLIHFLFFATEFIPLLPTPWLTPLLLLPIAFAIWPFWLLLLYLNSLIIKLLRSFGLFRNIPDRRAQNILWGIVTTIMAGQVLMSHPWLWQLAAIWLLAVVMNLIAALALSFSDAARGFDD